MISGPSLAIMGAGAVEGWTWPRRPASPASA